MSTAITKFIFGDSDSDSDDERPTPASRKKGSKAHASGPSADLHMIATDVDISGGKWNPPDGVVVHLSVSKLQDLIEHDDKMIKTLFIVDKDSERAGGGRMFAKYVIDTYDIMDVPLVGPTSEIIVYRHTVNKDGKVLELTAHDSGTGVPPVFSLYVNYNETNVVLRKGKWEGTMKDAVFILQDTPHGGQPGFADVDVFVTMGEA